MDNDILGVSFNRHCRARLHNWLNPKHLLNDVAAFVIIINELVFVKSVSEYPLGLCDDLSFGLDQVPHIVLLFFVSDRGLAVAHTS